MMYELDGKFYRTEEVLKEVSELEFLREKVKELEERIRELEMCRLPQITYPPYSIQSTGDPRPPFTITCDHLYRPDLVTY